jgi:hypothetical protein
MVALCGSVLACDGRDRLSASSSEPAVATPGGRDSASNRPAQTPTDAGAQPTPSEPRYSLTSLPRDLLGYWDLGHSIGGCIDVEDYLAFFEGGATESIRVNNDACYPEDRGLFITPATYALDGRTLSVTTDAGVTRSAIAVGERSGGRYLYRQVLMRVGPLHWQEVVEWESRYADEASDAGATQLLGLRYQVDLFFNASPPSTGEAAGTAELHYELTWPDESRASDEREREASATLTALTWRERPDTADPSLQQIEVSGIPPGTWDDLAVSSILLGMLSFNETGIWLSLDPGQPDHFSGAGVPALAAPPAALGR